MQSDELSKLLLAQSIEALNKGTRHYDIRGNLLKTEREILEALTNDGEITFEMVAQEPEETVPYSSRRYASQGKAVERGERGQHGVA